MYRGLVYESDFVSAAEVDDDIVAGPPGDGGEVREGGEGRFSQVDHVARARAGIEIAQPVRSVARPEHEEVVAPAADQPVRAVAKSGVEAQRMHNARGIGKGQLLHGLAVQHVRDRQRTAIGKAEHQVAADALEARDIRLRAQHDPVCPGAVLDPVLAAVRAIDISVVAAQAEQDLVCRAAGQNVIARRAGGNGDV